MGQRIKTISVKGVTDEMLFLGYAGENNHTIVRIAFPSICADYPDAVAVLRVRPPEGDTYDAEITVENGFVIWTLSSEDTAFAGTGEYQLIFTDHGTEIFRTAIGRFRIAESLPRPST